MNTRQKELFQEMARAIDPTLELNRSNRMKILFDALFELNQEALKPKSDEVPDSDAIQDFIDSIEKTAATQDEDIKAVRAVITAVMRSPETYGFSPQLKTTLVKTYGPKTISVIPTHPVENETAITKGLLREYLKSKTHSCLNQGDINLEEYPSDIQQIERNQSLTIGDLHGNALKLIWVLIQNGVMNLKPGEEENEVDVYAKLVGIYKKDVDHLTKEDIDAFNQIIHDASFNQLEVLRIVGDELADRGKNDYFTLKLLEKIGRENINMEVMLSNHSVEFLERYKNLGKKGVFGESDVLDKGNSNSLYGLNRLVEKGIIHRGEIVNIVDRYYKPNLKPISYSIDRSKAPPTFTFHTHAPVGIETIEATAKFYNIRYDDSSLDELAKTIDKINEAFQKDIRSNPSIHRHHSGFLSEFGMGLGQMAIPHEHPLLRLMWNRGDKDLQGKQDGIRGTYGITLPEEKNGYLIMATHGHDGPSESIFRKEYTGDPSQSYFPNMINTDNDNGKRTLDGELHCIVSNDKAAPRPKLEMADEIDVKVLIEIRQIYTKYKSQVTKHVQGYLNKMPTHWDSSEFKEFVEDFTAAKFGGGVKNKLDDEVLKDKSGREAYQALIYLYSNTTEKVPPPDLDSEDIVDYTQRFKSIIGDTKAATKEQEYLQYVRILAHENQYVKAPFQNVMTPFVKTVETANREMLIGYAKNYVPGPLAEIKKIIENTDWKLGSWGSKHSIQVKGSKKQIPGHMKQIYDKIIYAERHPEEAIKIFKEINQIAKSAIENKPGFFANLRKRHATTTAAYEEIEQRSSDVITHLKM